MDMENFASFGVSILISFGVTLSSAGFFKIIFT